MCACTNVCAVQMRLHTITADYNVPLEAAHCYSDNDSRYNLVVLARAAGYVYVAHTGSFRSATRLQHRMCACTNVFTVQMCLYTITADYNGPF